MWRNKRLNMDMESFETDENLLNKDGDSHSLNDIMHDSKLLARHDSKNDSDNNDATKKSTTLKYGLEDCPPWYLSIFLGFQHYITMLGGSISLPVILAPAICIQNDEIAKTMLLNTMVFLTGLVTILQTTIGSRLPIIQGATFTMIAPAFAMFASRECPAYTGFREGAHENGTMNGTSIFESTEHTEMWQGRMREIQGSIAVASLFQVFVGATGLVGLILYYIGPLSVAPTIALIGLGFFKDAASFCQGHWGFTILSIVLMTIFSQACRREMPICSYTKEAGWHRSSYPIFELFPVVLTIVCAWSLSAILTASGVLTDDPRNPAYAARSDAKFKALTHSDWFRVPYPGQWGMPTLSIAGVIGMLSGVIAGIIESIGDYYACAELTDAPIPPVHAVNRGIFIEGVGCVLAGLWGSGAGTTSYTENLSVMAVTKVGSRRVIQVAGVLMLFIGCFAKFGAIFICIPDPIVGGISVVLFGLISSIGISNLRYADMQSSRNLYIFGLSIFFGIMMPNWLHSNPDAINTGAEALDQILTVLLGTSMFIGGFIGFFLDNILPGTEEERGIAKWRKNLNRYKASASTDERCYDLPLIMKWINKRKWMSKIPVCPTYKGMGITLSSLRSCKKGPTPGEAQEHA